ncbi:uncharacterized protein LOC128343388 isoform X1 [Hemicordylus capensis]|uniref:uncharacterized protein LOC128343388 isoform X1 n=1 Tax=Hemicordylus capensis TaxID=884348 RepID=UPI002303B013|nr:uncharacterized protein LOC128343388 isoform X1 [Hemicordylus capensis]
MIMWSRCSDRAEQSRSSMRVAGGGTAHSIPPLTTGRLHNPKEAHICGGMGVPGPYSETRSQQEGPAAPIRRLGYVVGKGLGCVEGSLPVRPPCISHLQHQQLPPVCAKKAPWGPGCQAEGIGEPQDIDTFGLSFGKSPPKQIPPLFCLFAGFNQGKGRKRRSDLLPLCLLAAG